MYSNQSIKNGILARFGPLMRLNNGFYSEMYIMYQGVESIQACMNGWSIAECGRSPFVLCALPISISIMNHGWTWLLKQLILLCMYITYTSNLEAQSTCEVQDARTTIRNSFKSRLRKRHYNLLTSNTVEIATSVTKRPSSDILCSCWRRRRHDESPLM
jgi:hypothetical protein